MLKAAVEHEAADRVVAEGGQQERGQDEAEEQAPGGPQQAHDELIDGRLVARTIPADRRHGPVAERQAVRQDGLQAEAQHDVADGVVGDDRPEERGQDAINQQGPQDGDRAEVAERGQPYRVITAGDELGDGPAVAVDGGDAARSEVGRSGVVAQERLQARCTGGCGG